MGSPLGSNLHLLPDYRVAGRKMLPCNLKLPEQYRELLHKQAGRIGVEASTLARHLLIRGLEGLPDLS